MPHQHKILKLRAEATVLIIYVALFSRALPLVRAHGNEPGEGPSTTMNPETPPAAHEMESYFRHPHYAGWNMAHTISMTLAWVMVLPLAIMLSVARSRYRLIAQVLFHVLNSVGLLTAVVYNASTPDLYPRNAHHGLGWAVAGFAFIWTIISIYLAYQDRIKLRATLKQRNLVASQSLYRQFHDDTQSEQSNESDKATASTLLNSSQSSLNSACEKQAADKDIDDEGEDELEAQAFLRNTGLKRLMKRQRISAILRFCQIILEKILLLLGFAAFTSGFIVSSGLFRDIEVFNGLAHYIKGGIFFWYGILTLGRWMGAFSEFGWAWNVRPRNVPKWKARVPSAEFTESFVIWAYGASNVFLEHLSGWGQEWTPRDLEHLSITVLFFGGGLLGMLVESKWARKMANTTFELQARKERSSPFSPAAQDGRQLQDDVPLNPMPALTIMLLGMMMGSHKQASMVSTMLHAQWGGLFSALAIARGVTYITLYLKPPTSAPCRPPSEIVASFCLCAGGLLFMNSAADIVWAIESNGFDAMSTFTVVMGLTAVVLAWEIVLFAIKGWAVRREEVCMQSV